MSHFITDESTSQLPATERLGDNDLFIVSISANGRYASRNLSYGKLKDELSGGFDIGDIKQRIQKSQDDIDELSSSLDMVSASVNDISSRFISNDFWTRTIPDLSSVIMNLSSDSILF